MSDRQQKINDLKESLKKILEIDGVKDALAKLERGAVDDADYINLLEENCDAWEKACHILRDKRISSLRHLENLRNMLSQMAMDLNESATARARAGSMLEATQQCLKIVRGES